MSELTITKENFDAEVTKSDKTVLLDFWATWCGPCWLIAPVIAEIAEEKQETVKVGKVNVDEQPELAAAFQIESIPTIVIVKNGVITDVSVGFRTKEQLEAML